MPGMGNHKGKRLRCAGVWCVGKAALRMVWVDGVGRMLEGEGIM